MRRLLLALVAGAAATTFAGPATAGCYGTEETLVVCATPPSLQEGSISQCVYTGGDTCETVTVPIVTPGPGMDVSCDEGTWLNDLSHSPCRSLDDIQPGR